MNMRWMILGLISLSSMTVAAQAKKTAAPVKKPTTTAAKKPAVKTAPPVQPVGLKKIHLIHSAMPLD